MAENAEPLPPWLLRQMAHDGRAPTSDPRHGTRHWLELMPEYTAPPLWQRGRGYTGRSPIAPEALGVSEELSARIWRWSDEYTAGGDTWPTEDEFAREGRALAQLLADELGLPVEYDDFVVAPRTA